MTGGSGVRGFLFADLRGYTRYIEAHGDAAAAEFLADYRSLVRVVIGRHEGAEIRTEGDGVYVVFESVIGAVDAALELVESAASASAANRDRPMPVAVGVHAGETAATGEGPVGSAVNIASRICAKAEAGEVLVSETVRSLVRTARPYRSTALGSQHLKGVAEAIPLYRLERGPSRLGTRLGRQARARRRTLAAAGLGLAVLAVAGAGAWAINRPPDCLSLPASTKNVVVRIDLERGCVTTLIGVGFRPGPIVATPDALWIGDRAGWTLTRVDPVKGAVTAWLGVPGSPISIAAAATGDLAVLAYDDRTPEQQRLTSRHRVIFVDADPAQTGTGALLPVERPDQQVGFPINQTSYTRSRLQAAGSGWPAPGERSSASGNSAWRLSTSPSSAPFVRAWS